MFALILIAICIILYIYVKNIPKKLHKFNIYVPKAPDVPDIIKIARMPVKKELVIDKVDMAYYSELSQRIDREERLKYAPIDAPVPTVPVSVPVPNVQVLRNFAQDAQNVHDSIVQSTIKIKYNNLDNNDNNDNNTNTQVITCKEQILQYASTINKQPEISDILRQIENRNGKISNINSTEVQVLNNAWHAANDNVKTQIINELLDTIENDYIVCPTGVVSHIINADVVNDPDLSPRTQTGLREEMLNIASKTRANLELTDTYKNCNDADQLTMLKDGLEKIYIKTYKDIIAPEIIQKEIDSWNL